MQTNLLPLPAPPIPLAFASNGRETFRVAHTTVNITLYFVLALEHAIRLKKGQVHEARL
jgi:hypothetical protein